MTPNIYIYTSIYKALFTPKKKVIYLFVFYYLGPGMCRLFKFAVAPKFKQCCIKGNLS